MKRMALTVLALALLLFFCGCTSVPHLDSAFMVKEGTYEVVIDRDYLETPEEFKYAVNSFVKNQGETSYDVEKHGPNDFYVYTPGSQAVEDLPKVRHFHTGRTAGLTLTMVGVPFWILLLVLVL